MCRDLELAVPGTYEPHKPVIHIRHVHASLNVITSKQRPRKLCITGECVALVLINVGIEFSVYSFFSL